MTSITNRQRDLRVPRFIVIASLTLLVSAGMVRGAAEPGKPAVATTNQPATSEKPVAASNKPADKPTSATPAAPADKPATPADNKASISPTSAAAPAPVKAASKYPLAPLPKTEKIAVTHAPFEAGQCSLCHKSDNVKDPGPLLKPVNQICLDCHDEQGKLLKQKSTHSPAKENCTNCHNPHNSAQPKLLHAELGSLCLSCHERINKLVTQSKVQHGALSRDKKCANCHNPHGAAIEHLLVQMPFDLCVQCHSKDDMEDHSGKKLVNIKHWIETNPVWHAPVAAKDCTACHKPHGSDNFRLLDAEYPPQFYSPYDPKNYAICFECHNDQMLTEKYTTTLTQFRNGNKNLHYVHVNKPDKGRTCRACHEVHAAKQAHQIRDGVPFGPKAWMLQLNYTRTEVGGYCEKTCHNRRGYDNTTGKAIDNFLGGVPPAVSATNAPSASAPAASGATPAKENK